MTRPAVVAGLTLCALSFGAHIPCRPDELLVYTAVFTANWTRDRFPKQYPEFRPPAQWSRVVGMSHNDRFKLFQLGTEASAELKLFAETGKQEILGSNENEGILDEFLLPAIKSGSGRVVSDFFVDANHSKVSLASRIVPSPDWFVGIDSLDLCADGHWVDTVTIEASPLDAGTDSGFTFTAPNWATEPQEGVYKITAQYPRHPANSFHYPYLQDLPAIASFRIIKKILYESHKVSSEDITSTTSSPNNKLPVHIDLVNDILRWKHIKKKMRKKKRSKKNRKSKKCEVGEWTDWSVCNAPCGQSQRTRNITQQGPLCPPLLQERTCGCTKYIFNW